MDASWLVGGGDPHEYHDSYQSGVQSEIGALSNSNIGAQGAANAERAIGRRYDQRQEQIESDPSYGRNAAVSGKLHDTAMSEVGGETSDAYVKGAQTDLDAKEKAANLGLQEGQLQFGINQENYQRDRSQDFGNSFLGGALKQAIGFGIGGPEQIGMGALAKAAGIGSTDEEDTGKIGRSGGLQFKDSSRSFLDQLTRGIHG